MTKPVRVLAVAVALGVLTSVALGTLTSSDEAEAATQHALRIPAAAFETYIGVVSYYNYGGIVQNSGSTTALFVAPVFLTGNLATIQSVTLHYYDNGPDRVCAELMRFNLKAGGAKTMSHICTRNAVDGFRKKTDTTIQPDTVGPDNATYLSVDLPNGQYGIYGVTIVYTSDM
jgi:hypothetical protein